MGDITLHTPSMARNAATQGAARASLNGLHPDGAGRVSTREPGRTLASDMADLSARAAVEAKALTLPEVADIQKLHDAHAIATQALWIGSALEPSERYTLESACDKLLAELTRLRDTLKDSSDPLLTRIVERADQAIAGHPRQDGLAASYTALFLQLETLQDLTADPPAQPQQTVLGLHETVDAARGKLAFASSILDDKAKLHTYTKGLERLIQEEKRGAGVRGWYGGKKRQIADLESKLATLKTASTQGMTAKLAGVSRKAHALSLQAREAKTLMDARSLTSAAAPIKQEAEALRREAAVLAETLDDIHYTLFVQNR